MTGTPTERAASTANRDRLAEIDRLAQAGEAGVPVLIGLLTEPDWSVRRAVIGALSALGAAALPALCTALLHDRRDETRIAALVDTLVGSTGDVEHALASLVASGNAAVTADIAQILGRRMSPSSVPTLVALLGQTDDNVAVAAIEALG